MPVPEFPIWETVVDNRTRFFAVAVVLLAAGAFAADLVGSIPATVGLAVGAGGCALMVVRRVFLSPSRSLRQLTYHSDEDGLLIAQDRGAVQRIAWDSIIEVRENVFGTLVLTTRDGDIRVPRHIARREAFGMAVFEKVVPRLAGELWDGLVNGRMVSVCPERMRIALTLIIGLAVGAALVVPGGFAWSLGVLGVGAVLLFLGRSRMRSVFLSARGIGDRDRFIAWEASDVNEHNWALVVRDADSGWIARIPRTVVNYHAIAVVARAAQALSGSGVESVAFRSAHDSGRVRIVVEGSIPGGGQYH